MTSTDWSALLGKLDSTDTQIKETEHKYESIFNHISNMSKYTSLSVLADHFNILSTLNVSCNIIYVKKKIVYQDLKPREQAIYQEILRECNSDKKLLHIYSIINNGPYSDTKLSGRTIDTFVTKYTRYYDTSYNLKRCKDGTYSLQESQSEEKDQDVIHFNVSLSYKRKVRQFSKAYFDCFARGCEVKHTLQNGQVIHITLCQFSFYIWADKFCIFEYLYKHLSDVVKIRKMAQFNNYTPKFKKRKKHEELPKMSNTSVQYISPMFHKKIRYDKSSKKVVMMKKSKPQNPVFYYNLSLTKMSV